MNAQWSNADIEFPSTSTSDEIEILSPPDEALCADLAELKFPENPEPSANDEKIDNVFVAEAQELSGGLAEAEAQELSGALAGAEAEHLPSEYFLGFWHGFPAYTVNLQICLF